MKQLYIATAILMALLIAPLGLAHGTGAHAVSHNSNEEVVVRLVSLDQATGTYTFWCETPPRADSPRIWSVRTTYDATTIKEVQGNGEFFTTTFPGKDLYHIACQVQDYDVTPSNVRGDFHVDLREAPYTDKTWITVESSQDLTATATCHRPDGSTATNYHWRIINANHMSSYRELSQFEGQSQITYTVDNPGIWDLDCSVGGSTFALPIEFFSDSAAYVPNAQGCVPNEPCGTNASMDMSVYNVPADSAPQVEISTQLHENQVEVSMDITNLNLVEKPNDPHVEGEGHAHWYFDGVKQGRIYSSTFLTPELPQGQHTIRITLSTNDHREYAVNNVIIEDSTQVTVAEQTTGDACVSSVADMPVYCDGAITTDSYNGCRTVACENAQGSTQILACDKGSGASTYFEMYKQAQTASGAKICLGDTCITANGFAKSSDYPYCSADTQEPTDDGTDNGGSTDDEGSGSDSTDSDSTDSGSTGGNTTCYESLATVPATCTGASITSDTYNGCRTIVCGGLQVLSCEKSASGATYFEMYKQSSTSGVEICLADVCIAGNGYAKSNAYPICTAIGGSDSDDGGEDTPTTGDQNSTNSSGGSDSSVIFGPPLWVEPAQNRQDMHPIDFHINVYHPQENEDAHISSDFEIVDVVSGKVVWRAYDSTDIKYHIHNGDGVFENERAGTGQLGWDTNYKLHARFTSSAGKGEWSEWRYFKTQPYVEFDDSPWDWTPRDGYRIERVASGVTLPTVLAPAPRLYDALPDSQRPKMYYTQLYGQLAVMYADESRELIAQNLLNFDSFGSLPGSGEIGLTGLYPDEATGDLFLSIVYYDNNNKFKGKVERFVMADDGVTVLERKVLLSGIDVSAAHQVHEISRGPDGKLYLQVGDADRPADAQDTSKYTGKVLRMNEDGSIPSDNPYGNYVWASGFRNDFGGDWRPGTNELFVTNNGPDDNDAIYKVTRGSQFGWTTGGDTRLNAWVLFPQTVAPTDLLFDDGSSNFPDSSHGTLYAVLSGPTYTQGPSLVSKRIMQYKIKEDGSSESLGALVTYTGDGYGAPIGMAFLEDGLYFTDIYGEVGFTGIGQTKGNIYRVSPGTQVENPNKETQVVFEAAIGQGRWFPQDLNMIWVCKATGGSGNYKYDFSYGDGNGQYNIDSDNVYYTYASQGTYQASCTIRDVDTGLSSTSTTTLVLGENTGDGTGGDGEPPAGDTGSNGDSSGGETDDGSTCAESVNDVAVSCNGATITSDTWNGCRTVVCGDLKVQACDKAGFFEMYKQSGTSGVEICLANTCVSNNGYAKSANFPICSENNEQNPSEGEENSSSDPKPEPQPSTPESSVAVEIAPWYPKGMDYIFVCEGAQNAVNWSFGDGDKQQNAQARVYHTYAATGSYSVSCTDVVSKESGSLEITVQ